VKPRPFPQANRRLLPPPGVENCDPLETFCDGEQVISCWQMSADELAEVNRNGGRVWVRVWSGHTSPPIAVQANDPFRVTEESERG
jgi:hypothetical protein